MIHFSVFASHLSLMLFLIQMDGVTPFDATRTRTSAESQLAQQTWAKKVNAKPVVANTVGIDFVLIPPGKFQMGSSEGDFEQTSKLDPLHKRAHMVDEMPQIAVRITRPFYLAKNEITIANFRHFVNATSYQTDSEKDGQGGWGWNESKGEFEGPKPEFSWKSVGWPQADLQPVVNISWNDAIEYVNWLRKLEGKPYRLPTEAEWEYACRAGTIGIAWHGSDPERLVEIANTCDAVAKKKFSRYVDCLFLMNSDGHAFSSPVGSFRANPFGLYDMLGNAREWCSDDYVMKLPGGDDPLVLDESGGNVVRGGCWLYSASSSCRSASRTWIEPHQCDCFTGFRIAIDLPSR